MDSTALFRIALLAMSLAVIGFSVLQSLTRSGPVVQSHKALLIFLGLYALLKLDELLIVTGFYVGAPQIAGVLAPLRMLIAPAFFLYVRTLTAPEAKLLRRTDLWALTGPAGFALLMSWYFILPPEAKRDLLTLTFADTALRDLAFAMCGILFGWFFVFSAAYVLLSLRALHTHALNLKSQYSDIRHRTLNWLKIASVILLAMLGWFTVGEVWAILGSRPQGWSEITAFIELAAVGVFCVCALSQSPPPEPAERQITSPRWRLPEDQLERIGATLTRCMETQKLYADPDLSLKALATAARCSEDHVTQALNHHLNTSFYAFVNSHRIHEARRLLRESDLSVLDISLEAGFNSKSTFNAAFKKVTGRTPTAFRDEGTD